MKGKNLLLITFSLLLVLGLGGGIGGLWQEARAERPEAPGEAPLLSGPMGTGFTYQGQLIKDDSPVDDTCDFEFSLWDEAGSGSPPIGGTQIGVTQTVFSVTVTNGLFTVQLDFGDGAFTGEARWLEIAVRCPAGGDGYTALSPRQSLTPTPYALALYGLWTQQDATSPNLIGGYSGNWVTGGLYGATIGGGGESGFPNRVTDIFGTVGGGSNIQAGDNSGTTTDSAYATVGGGWNNAATDGNATVSGGGDNTASGEHATVGGGYFNTASGSRATVGGGVTNTAGADGDTVGGGEGNTASGSRSTVGGGYENTAFGFATTVPGGHQNTAGYGWAATVGGGEGNTASNDYVTVGGGSNNTASGLYATVGGGYQNTASNEYVTVGGGWGNTANAEYATVGGGVGNTAVATLATVGGGYNNVASGNYATVAGGYVNTASDHYATVGGGDMNTADGGLATVAGGVSNIASGSAATIPGGSHNTAQGHYSFAAGRRAKANHEGAFVWGDSTDADVASTGTNQFIVRASGGIWFGTTSSPSIPAGRFINTSTGGYLSTGGAWTDSSDLALKENFTPVDGQQVLERLAGLPITEWNYLAQDLSIRHMGPNAQDFYAAFGLGEDDRHIASLDTNGVALAAIQGLYQMVQEKDAQIAAQQQQIDDLEARVAALEAGTVRPMQAGFLPGGWSVLTILLIGLGVGWLARRGNALSLPKRGGR